MTRPINPIGLVAVAAVPGGLLAWAWLGDWRWAVTGLAALLVLATVSAALDRRRE